MATACCSTTRGARATARAPSTRTAGAGRRTPPRRSTSSPSATTSTPLASACSASRPVPTSRSTSPPAATTSAPGETPPPARRDDVQAVVADGSAATGYEDIKAYTHAPLTRAPMWVLFKTIELIEGRSGPEKSLADQIAGSHAPHLLVSAGKPEKEWGELYDEAGGTRSELWHLPKASHTAALKQYPKAYEQRVVSFLDTNLRAKYPDRAPPR